VSKRKSISVIFSNSYSKYFWRHVIELRPAGLVSFRENCNEDRDFNLCNWNWDNLAYKFGVDDGERCLFPAPICRFCQKSLCNDNNHIFGNDWEEFNSLRDAGYYWSKEPTEQEKEENERRFLKLYERAAFSRYTYQNCGCVTNNFQEVEFWVKVAHSLLLDGNYILSDMVRDFYLSKYARFPHDKIDFRQHIPLRATRRFFQLLSIPQKLTTLTTTKT
jgi:hypothetical protein